MADEDHPVVEEWKKHEEEASALKGKHNELRARYNDEINPARRCLHANFITISVIAVLALFLMIISQCVGFYFEETGPVSGVMRVYVIILCILGILAELEWTSLANSGILKCWTTRGMFYAFVGVLGMQENESTRPRSSSWSGNQASLLYVKVIAWVMIGLGGIYFLMGLCCMQYFYTRQREDYVKRKERAKTVKETSERYGTHPALVV